MSGGRKRWPFLKWLDKAILSNLSKMKLLSVKFDVYPATGEKHISSKVGSKANLYS